MAAYRPRLRAVLFFGLLLAGWTALLLHHVAGELPAAVASSVRTTFVVLVIGSGLGGCLVAWLAARSAHAPVADLMRLVHAMKSDLRVRARLRGDHEVARLGEAIDELARDLLVQQTSLEEDRNRLIAILESMAEGVLVTGPRKDGGIVVLANAALREMLVLDRAIIGRSPMEVIRVVGLDEILQRAARSPDGASAEIELSGLRPGRILVRATPIQGDESREDRGLVAVFNDVTELRRLENIRRDFVANVSHELRTPITAISSATETLLGGALQDPEAAQQFVAIVSRHASRLRGLVEDLLELSRIESREWKLTMQPVDVTPVIAASLEAVTVAARQRGATLRSDLDEDLPLVQADPRALEQVLVNLLDNGVKYGGVRPVIDLEARAEDDVVRLLVRDHGPGIEPRHLPRLFERFYRVDPGRSRAVGGTGLGLSIVKHLVEAMGGRIELQSRVGAGTTFAVSLRVARVGEQLAINSMERSPASMSSSPAALP